MSAKLVFSSGLSESDRARLSDHSREVLVRAAEKSNNPKVVVNSLLRPPRRQANAMYDNLIQGIRIGYKKPGQIVTDVFDACHAEGLSRDRVVDSMTAKIEELSAEGRRVSLHCVSEAEYARRNIVDVSYKRGNLPNPRDFVKALLEDETVDKVITPVGSKETYGNSSRVVVDGSEPAVHVEINQPED